ncbi:substrate-binding domain-containing protein [Saccharopolyspora halophila]|uniref:substrate-binding domain-containing protein n=1 Tax=Saccharopolyspora halophila TaxID=405551 RepID=UPI003CD06786
MREALARFRAQPPEVTALAAFDENTELRALAAINDLGLHCPEDLAVIGFDAVDIGSLVTPALTAAHIDAEGRGRLAARLGARAEHRRPPAEPRPRGRAGIGLRVRGLGFRGRDANHAPCGRLHRSPYGARSVPHVCASVRSRSPGTFLPVPGLQLAGRLGAVVTSFSSFGGIPSSEGRAAPRVDNTRRGEPCSCRNDRRPRRRGR